MLLCAQCSIYNGGKPRRKCVPMLLKLADVIEENRSVFAELESVIVAKPFMVFNDENAGGISSMFFAFWRVRRAAE